MAQDPYKYFRIEAQDLLDQLGRAVLDLGKQTTSDTVARLLRLAHTLKGAARVVKCGDIAERAHAVEEVVQPLRTTAAPASPELIDALLGHMDAIGAQVAALPSPAGARAVENISVEEPLRTVRTDVLEVEALLDGIAEAHVRLGTLRSELNASADIRYLLDLLNTQLASRPGRDATVDTTAGQARALAEQLAKAVDNLVRNLSVGVEQVDRELKEVHEAAERMRLVPADSLFLSLERTVRDVAQALGKEAVFEGRGGDLRVDGHVLNAAH
ncbi:MAG TPA: Hpt domain-containing protein, partial [Burkholderiales bacterium]